MKNKIVDKTNDYSKLVSPRRDKDKPIYNWHSFKHSYSKELVDLFINEFKLNNNSKILDMFCGGGTTLLAAKENSIFAVGYDISPFAVFLSQVKTNNYDKKVLSEILTDIAKKLDRYIPSENVIFPEIPLLKKAFKKKTWHEINYIKKVILRIKDRRIRDFFSLSLLSILESVSNTSKTGGFLRIVSRRISSGTAMKNFVAQAQRMINDLNNNGNIKSKVKIGDARRLKEKNLFDAIITSPPYPNRHDYTRIYALELILFFINNNEELKQLRYNTLRSHVEAKKKYHSNGYQQPPQLTKALSKVERNGVNNIQIIDMLKGYFEDMYLTLKEMHRLLNKTGKIALVVSNVRFSGINILVDEILSELGEQVGLKTKEIRIIRYRGNSSQQMRDYNKLLSRESIIIWEK